MNKCILVLTCILISFVSEANTYTVETVPNVQLQDAGRFVSNPDDIISNEAEDIINQTVTVVKDSTTAEIAVVLLQSIGDKDIDDFATDLFMYWGIGKKETDNGLLFLLVEDQRQMVFRTGYGLEGILTDALLGQIIRHDISPYLKNGDFDNGVISGIRRACDCLLNPEIIPEIYSSENEQSESNIEVLLCYLLIGFLICLPFIIWSISILSSKKKNYQKYMSFKKGKGIMIFFTVVFPISMVLFCIFYFIIRKWLRNQPINCPECGNKMRKLSQKEETPFLNKSQQTEEKIGSIDYDVWQCDHKHREIYPYKKISKYMPCPYCYAVAYYTAGDKVITRATTYSSGIGEQLFNCRNCGKSNRKQYRIPKIVATSSSSSSGSSFGGSSSGGGSWGGGSTGGGGARGGW